MAGAAAEADDFVAASRSQQAQLLSQWAAAPQADRPPLLRALTTESLVMDDGKHAFRTTGRITAIGRCRRTAGRNPTGPSDQQAAQSGCRRAGQPPYLSDNVTERASAARTLQREATPAMAALLQQRLQAETDDTVRGLLRWRWRACSSLSLRPVRLAAVTLLGHSADPETQALLIPFTDAQHEPDAAVREAASDSLQKIKHRLLLGDLLGQAFMGLSLIGAVAGRAGAGDHLWPAGVINMAHGEMLMIGAYSCWLVQQALAQLAPQWLAFIRWSLPVAFLVTAGIGAGAHHYSSSVWSAAGNAARHLGISLMLIQLVRMLFGAQNVEVANPAWLSGGVQVLPNLILPWNRLAVLAFVLLVLSFTWLILNRTRLGMNVRAVTQNRAMAACCGVPTGRVDMLAFGLGSGIAGLGGVALSQLGNVGPELGQGYIIDSFLVVVLGGVGQLAGSVAAAFGLGIFNKILEPQMGAVLGKILILVMIILFIQKRPQGLFALKGRLLTNEPTNHLNAGAARAAASALAGDPAGAGAAVYFLALLPASHPLAVPSWLLTLSGKILCYAIVAVALDLVWGYAGMLSLGHGSSLPSAGTP